MKILLDIGGSNIRVSSSIDDQALGEVKIMSTPKNFDKGMQDIEEEFKKIAGDHQPTSLSVGIAGRWDEANKNFTNHTNLTSWSGKPLYKTLQEVAGQDTPIKIDNDAALAALAEARIGSGKDHKIVGYLTIGTGVGGAKIINGVKEANVMGFEPGAQIIDASGTLIIGTAPPYTLENYISGHAFEKRHDKKPHEVTDNFIWDTYAAILAIGLYNLIQFWSPEIIVLGGSMMKTPGISLENTVKHLQSLGANLPQLPVIKLGELGDNVVLQGGLFI